ncbi:MAG: hypothetical protein ACLVLD_30160 [Hungatella sp.]
MYLYGAGQSAAVSLDYFGMDRVMVCDRSDFRFSAAGRLGFTVCNNDRDDCARNVTVKL